MALQKSFELQSGISGNYWRITSVGLNPAYRTADITICLYYNSNARENEKQVLWCKPYQINGDNYDTYVSPEVLDTKNPLKSCYEYLKTTPEFFDAVDV